MEFYDVINKRRSIRQFKEQPIPEESLKRILDAGLKAPSSNHQRAWDFVVVTDKDKIKDLSKIVKNWYLRNKDPKTPQQEMFKIAYPRQKSMIAESGAIIMPYFKEKYAVKNEKNDYGLWDYGAVFAVIENMWLAAYNEGLSACLHIPTKKEPEQIHEYLGVPEKYYLPAMLMIGYAADDAETPTQVRADIEKNVHWNGWK